MFSCELKNLKRETKRGPRALFSKRDADFLTTHLSSLTLGIEELVTLGLVRTRENYFFDAGEAGRKREWFPEANVANRHGQKRFRKNQLVNRTGDLMKNFGTPNYTHGHRESVGRIENGKDLTVTIRPAQGETRADLIWSGASGTKLAGIAGKGRRLNPVRTNFNWARRTFNNILRNAFSAQFKKSGWQWK